LLFLRVLRLCRLSRRLSRRHMVCLWPAVRTPWRVHPMTSSAPSPAPRRSQPPGCASLSILRTETVLSRFPIHNLTKHGPVTIRIRRTNAYGELEVRWEVSYNEHYGPPGALPSKLDTLVINR